MDLVGKGLMSPHRSFNHLAVDEEVLLLLIGSGRRGTGGSRSGTRLQKLSGGRRPVPDLSVPGGGRGGF